jgi:hypothetical protein
VDGNPPATRSLHRIPFLFKQGVEYTLDIDYRNQIYTGETDIDGITVFAMRAFPADIAFVDMGGNPMVFLPSVRVSELEALAAKNLSKANLLKALETKLFRVQLLDFSADGEGVPMKLVSLDENGNPQGDYEDITLQGSPATSQPAIAFWGASFLSTQAETYFRNKEVAFIHNAEIQVVDESGRLALKSDEEKKPTLKGLLATQDVVPLPLNRIIYEAGQPITFQLDTEGPLALADVMTAERKHKARIWQNGRWRIVTNRAVCVLSWDFNTDASVGRSDAEANEGREDRNQFKLGVTNWPPPADKRETVGHPADKTASVSLLREQNPAGMLSHTVTFKNMEASGGGTVNDSVDTITINHVAANHRKTYAVRGIFGFRDTDTPQTIWLEAGKKPYELRYARAGEYRAYEMAVRVALEKFVGVTLPENLSDSEGKLVVTEVNPWLTTIFNVPTLTSEQINELSTEVPSGQEPPPWPNQHWSFNYYKPITDNKGNVLGLALETVTFNLGKRQNEDAQKRNELIQVLRAFGALDGVIESQANGEKTYLGKGVQINRNYPPKRYAIARTLIWPLDSPDITIVGVGLTPLAFEFESGDVRKITQDEVLATLIHEAVHLRQHKHMQDNGAQSPYWLLRDCRPLSQEGVKENNPFFELEARLEEMVDPRISYRYLLKTETVQSFVFFYDRSVGLLNENQFELGVAGGDKRAAALQLLKKVWKTVAKFYPELQKDGYEYPKLRTPDALDGENFKDWESP